jgi:outer membrane lipoprotein-sorting protein
VPRILTALLCLLIPIGAAFAQAPTPQFVVQAFRDVYASVSDYQCRMHESCRQGSAFEERTANIYFKRPRFIRMDIIIGNRPGDDGSSGVYRNDGRVTGRKGGLLSFLAVTVDKHDPQATSIRGVAIDQIDLQATLEKLIFHLAASACSLELRDGVYEMVFVPRDPTVNGGVTKDIIRLDAATLLPISADSYEGSERVQHAEWSGYILNAGLPDQLFDVKWNPRQLEASGIPSVQALPVR